jgi:DNA-binding MarR family transcriptional regulator
MTSDPADCANMNIRRASRGIGQFFDDQMKGADVLPTQFSLMILLDRLAPASISTIAETIGMERTTLTRNLKLLERDDLVAQETGADARVRHYALTPEGKDVVKQSWAYWQKAQDAFSSKFGAERWQFLQSELRALEQCLADQ